MAKKKAKKRAKKRARKKAITVFGVRAMLDQAVIDIRSEVCEAINAETAERVNLGAELRQLVQKATAGGKRLDVLFQRLENVFLNSVAAISRDADFQVEIRRHLNEVCGRVEALEQAKRAKTAVYCPRCARVMGQGGKDEWTCPHCNTRCKVEFRGAAE